MGRISDKLGLYEIGRLSQDWKRAAILSNYNIFFGEQCTWPGLLVTWDNCKLLVEKVFIHEWIIASKQTSRH